MRFTEAWASVARQNLTFKRATVVLSAICLFLALALLRLSFKDTIVIERGCLTNLATTGDDKRSPKEIEAFLRESLPQRFNTDSQPIDGYIGAGELVFRNQEQKEFKSRSMTQTVLIRSIAVDGDAFNVNADRVISVGDVRSAFRFPLRVKLESRGRSAANPYGLVLVSAKPIDKDAK